MPSRIASTPGGGPGFRWVSLLCAGALLGCATPRTEPTTPAPVRAKPKPTALHHGPLTDYVAAAGLRWMVVARLSELAQTPGLPGQLERLFPEQRLKAFHQSSGVELTSTPTALAAGSDYATLYLVETKDGKAIESKFRDRLLSEKRSRPHPSLSRSSGVIGLTPEALVHIEGKLVAVSVGDPTPARVVELFAREKLSRSRPALEGAALSTLPPNLSDAPLVFYAPGPFIGRWENGGRGLLGAAVAVGAAVVPLANGNVRVKVLASGDWDQVPDASTRLLGAWEDLATSRLGLLLGLDRPVSEPEIAVDSEHVTLTVVLEVSSLASGLHAAVSADVWQMMDLTPTAPVQPLEPRPPPSTTD